MSKKFETKSTQISLKSLTKKQKYILVSSIIGAIAFISIFYISFGLQTPFQPTDYTLFEIAKPPEPPHNIVTGYARIYLYDYNNDTYFDGTINLYDYNNESFIGSVQTNTTFYLNDTTIAFANVTGYHLQAPVLKGSATGYMQNIIQLERKTFNGTMSFKILSVDGNATLQHIDNITNGDHFITFQVNNSNHATYFDHWGVKSWLPNGTYQDKPLTIFHKTNGTASWIAWKGNISNVYVQPQGLNWIKSQVYNVTGYNVTFNVEILDTLTFTVAGTFQDITGIHLYQGFIDNYLQDIVNVTLPT